MDSLSLPFFFPKVPSPALSENEMSLNFPHQYQGYHSPPWQRTECRQSYIPVCRMTRRHSISFSSVIPRFFPDDEMSKVSSPVCLVQRCHQSKCLFLQTISLQIHFKISQCLFKILFSFHLSSYNYQHGSGQSFSPVKLQYPLAESGPFLQRIWVSLCSSSFKTSHPCRPTFIITSRAFITS